MKNRADAPTIPAMPNSYPYNELLLSGKLSVKTRSWRWNHTGLTLLYTSTSTARDVARAHGLDPKGAVRGIIVGVGHLVAVREITSRERKQIEKEFCNGKPDVDVGAAAFRYEFLNLLRFKDPIPFRPPQGAVRLFHVPVPIVDKALKEIGISLR